MISIVIPVYNGEKYLTECIESCVNQSYKDIEIIIVNDGSTDGTVGIMQKYYRLHPDLITTANKKNGGTASALNVGIGIMKGEWFKWLSADDTLETNALAKMMKHIDKIHNSFKFLYYTDYDIIDEQGLHLRTFKEPDRIPLTDEQRSAELYHNFFGNGSTSLIHKDAIKLVGTFKEGMPYNDDYEYWLRWGLKFKLGFYHIPIVSVRYRVHDDSLTSTKPTKENQMWLDKIRKEYEQYLDKDQKKYLKTLRRPLKSRIAKHLPEPILNRLLRRK